MTETVLRGGVDAVPTTRRVYVPRGAAHELFTHRGDEVLLSGPAGTGKSMACLMKLHMIMLKNPGARGLIVRKTATSLTSTALVTWRQHVAKEAIESGLVRYWGGSAEEPPQYRYFNGPGGSIGSRVMLGGMDRATRIMSSEYDVVFAQEAIELTLDDWEAITTRLRNGRVSFQQLMADTNPAQPTHWLNQRAQAGTTAMLESRHQDNPMLYDDDGERTERGRAYLAKLDRLTGVRHKRLALGLWVAAEGQIYDEWDPAIHHISRFDIPHSWPRYWVVDFGYTHPFVLQWWATDPDGRAYLYREIYRTGCTVDQHAASALKWVTRNTGSVRDSRRQGPPPRSEWIEPVPQAVICDHDAEGRATLTKELGLPTVPAKKAVKDGIQAVQRRLRKQGDGRPRLFVLRDSTVRRDQELVDAHKPTSTVEEIPGYVWDAAKEAPVKEEDDGCDAMRYLVAHLDLRGEYNIRFVR
ncbi:MAG: phage terminase large subunit [Acidimicrobiia bacterium]|jgi:phage terminase large subunit